MSLSKQIKKYKDVSYNYIINYSPKVLKAIVIFFIFYFIALIIYNKLINIIYTKDGEPDKKSKNKIVVDVIAKLLYYLLLLIGLFAALVILGININSILVLFGTVGLAVALSLKDTMSNASSGIMIILLDYYDIGNLVEIDKQVGYIDSFNLFTTTIKNTENILIKIPNSSITQNVLINYSKNETIFVAIYITISNYDKNVKINSLIDNIKESLKEKCQFITDKNKIGVVVYSMEHEGTNLKIKIPIKSNQYIDAKNNLNYIIRNVIEENNLYLLDYYYTSIEDNINQSKNQSKSYKQTQS
jgi:small conductance mechanosensitive channel